jgi:hypothetical protein
MKKFVQHRLLCAGTQVGISSMFLGVLMVSFPVLAQNDAAKPQIPRAATEAAGPVRESVEARVELPAEVEAHFTRFNEWAEKYRAATTEAKTALLPLGIELASARLATMKTLIPTNPQAALQRAVSWKVRQVLPPSIIELLEKRVSGRGEFMVLIIDQIDPQTGQMRGKIQRLVTLGIKTYHAHVYGRRAGVTSKRSLPLHGIAIELDLAVHESPIRLLEEGEVPDEALPVANPDKRCPITGKDATQGVIADVGGTIYYFAREADLQSWTRRIEEQENIIGPNVVAP